MSDLLELEKYLKARGALSPSVPPILQSAVDCINTKALPKMKIAMAVSELTTFASHLRKPIQFNEKLVMTTNGIAFVLARSGAAKDSSVNAVRTALQSGYDTIKSQRELQAKVIAQEKAINAGEEPEDYYKYMRVLRPLMPELGTVQGMTSHFSALSEGTIGAGMVSTSEIGSELLSNGELPMVMTLLAKAYDVGSVPATIVKADEHQVDEIIGFPVNALFFGTESVILHDQKVKAMFIQATSSQLARRSLFSYNPGAVPVLTGVPVEERIRRKEIIASNTINAQNALEALVADIVSNTNTAPLTLAPEVVHMYDMYLEYNELRSLEVPSIYPLAEIARKHYQWRALKLAGVYAIYDKSNVITTTHFANAINTLEIFADDLMMFERELIKESYEQFADIMHSIAVDGKAFMSIHNLRKSGFIPSSAEARMLDLAKSATSYDPHGIYTVSKEGVHYEGLIPIVHDTPEDLPFTTSYLAINDDMSAKFATIYKIKSDTKRTKAKDDYKQYLGSLIKSDYETVHSSFADIALALSSNAALSNYEFTGGVRLKDNLINSTNWLLFDIDTSTLSIDTIHFMLQDINHHLVRGSDDNNDYKYHLAIELSTTLSIEPKLWRHFMSSIAKYLGIQHDRLPQSQVMFCYANREVLSVTDKSTLDVKDHILAAQALSASGPAKELTDTQRKALRKNAFSTFSYAYEAMNGEGSRSLIRAAYEAQSLGMDADEICTLLEEISDYWESPFPANRLAAMQDQIRSW